MSEWRRKAIAQFPRRADEINRSANPNDLWFTLLLDLQAAYRAIPPQTDLVDDIWSFAAWCFDPKRDQSVQNAVAVGFYEHLPHFGPARREMASRLARASFDRLLECFRTVLTKEEFGVFVDEFLRGQGAPTSEIRRFRRTAT